jgi:hypothetical protein
VSTTDQRPLPPAVPDPTCPGGTVPDEPDPAAPPQQPDRTLALLTADGLAYLAYWMVILILLSQAITSALRPPQGAVAAGLLAGLVCLVWSSFCLGMGILRGKRPDGADLPPPTWLPVIAAAGCLASLVILRSAVGMAGPWPAELVVSGLLVAAVTVWGGGVAGALVGAVLAALLLAGPFAQAAGETLIRTPLSSAVAGVVIIGLGFAVALAIRWLRRSALQLQSSLEVRDELLVRERSVLVASRVAAEVERALHDTALNTLETIAAHGGHLDPDVVRARCRADADQLARWRSESGFAGLGEVITRLEEHAQRLGVELVVDQLHAPGPGDPVDVPPTVLHALAGAASEALTNVHKHSGVRRAGVLVLHDVDGVQMLVADQGVGIAPVGGTGYGVVHSVQERMAAVGGDSLVGPGPDGVGTVVALGWQPPAAEAPAIEVDLLARVAGVVVSVGVVMAGVACALVVLGWSAYTYPVAALVAPFLAVLVAAWILNDARDGRAIGATHVVAACATYVLVGATTPIADQYCASLVGEGLMVDARVALLAVVLLLAPRPGVLAAVIGAVVATHLAAALAWNARWAGCGPDTAGTGVYVLAGMIATWMFARRMDRVTAEFVAARREATEVEVRIRSQLTVRAEEELWVADTLSSAQAVLRAVADGDLTPGAPDTRARCAAEAGFLRALLAVGRAPDPLRRAGRIWLRLLHAAGCTVAIRGSLRDLAPPPVIIGQVGGVLDTVAAMAPGASVTLAGWDHDAVATLMVTGTGPRVAHAHDTLTSRVHRVAGEAWRDFSDGSVSVEWSWRQGTLGGAGDSR